MSAKPFYITTTLPYVNAEAHMGHALEFVRADIIARWKKSQGYDVYFNTGTDEHGQKLYEAAQKEGKPVREYVDAYAQTFKELLPKLGLGVGEGAVEPHFIRTTEAKHEKAATEFWKLVQANGFIYKKAYKAKYCVGCEENKTESDLVDGKCPIHQNRDLEIREEENYFFKYSSFGDKLLALYDAAEKEGRSYVVPGFRLNEMREFVKRGLEDFSISRLKSKMAWGVPVPGDEDHVMYVWFDALTSYISTFGWPDDAATFERFWTNGTPTQYCGKDNTRFQSAMWQAMLFAAGLPNSHTIVINGFITAEGGVKMSKSLGNAVSPLDVVNEYGTDTLRYFLAREIGSFEDSPFTIERFKASYNSGLANGIGNLASRVMKMASTNLDGPVLLTDVVADPAYAKALDSFDISAATSIVWKKIGEADALIQEKAPFKLVKTDKTAAQEIIKDLVLRVAEIAVLLRPIMPQTAEAIYTMARDNKMPDAPLFLRKE
ncbi:MAG: methionine--tRNA ligase [bacterium]|nr:methionine--tRNA ligase [bacterium]